MLYCRFSVVDEVAGSGLVKDGAYAFLAPALRVLAVVRHLDLVGGDVLDLCQWSPRSLLVDRPPTNCRLLDCHLECNHLARRLSSLRRLQ